MLKRKVTEKLTKVYRKTEAQSVLDGLIVNIELTLTSIIQGVALYFLTDNARGPLEKLDWPHWIYVANGLLIIFIFWSRSVIHTLTLIRWPIEFSHNFLYIICALFEATLFTHLTDPIQWFGFCAVFAVWVLILFIVDQRLINQRRAESGTSLEEDLYLLISRDQQMNIRCLVPLLLVFHAGAAVFLNMAGNAFALGWHLVPGLLQTLSLLLYLIYLLKFSRHVGGLVLACLQAPRQAPL